MPPASLPALAVMTPGPRIARYTNRRGRRATVRRTPCAPRRNSRLPAALTLARLSGTWRVLSHVPFSEFNHPLPQAVLTLAEQLRQTLPPVFRQKNFYRVVHGHDSEYLAGLINNRKRQQIIFGDLLRYFDRIVVRVRDLQVAAHHIF